MRRFYLNPEACNEPRLLLRGDEAHHAARVLRIEVGERVAVLDGAGRILTCVVHSVSKAELLLDPVQTERFPQDPTSISLVCGIPKGGSFDDILDQAIELGAHEVVPLVTDHGNVRLDSKHAREKHHKWQAAAVESIKQCGSPWLPTVAPVSNVGQAAARGSATDLVLLSDLRSGSQEIGQALEACRTRLGRLPASVSIWVGPEGDFSPRELGILQNARAISVTLGPRVLRCATAAVASVALLAHQFRLAVRKG